MNAASLTTHYWDLQSIRDAQGKVRSPVQTAGKPAPRLTFIDGRVVAERICNTMTGAYTADGNRIQVGRVMSTMIGCMDDDVVALEQLVGGQLPQMKRYQLQQTGERAQLTLVFADGSQWQLAGTATPETLYGGAGERIFLEIAPQRQACTHGVMKNHQCLRVREIRYRDNGVKSHTGEWQNFYDEIQGFTHRAGEHNLLRLKRFERKNAPADASRYVYILDMVVEHGIGK